MGNFNTLPTEIVLEILSRVPAESIVECKLVCKPWKNLLQHPSFSQMHLDRLNDAGSSQCSLILYTYMNTFYYVEYDENLKQISRKTRINLRPPLQDCYIICSCNGLICFEVYYDGNCQPAYVCNPITRECVVVTKYEGKGSLLYGFGYSSSTNEYKVVRVSRNYTDPHYEIIQIYTLGSGVGWRYGRKMDYDPLSFRQCGVFANGALHWVHHKGTIVSFDLTDEEFRELPSPPCSLVNIVELHGLGDSLHASCYNNAGVRDLWVLKKNIVNHDVIWCKEFTHLNDKPITFTKNAELLCSNFYHSNNIYRYAPKASSSGMLVEFQKSFSYGIPHKNTLVSLKTLGEKDTKLM